MDSPRLLFFQSNELAEGPLWDERTQTLYWLDILSGTIWRSRWGSGGFPHPEAWSLSSRIGALGLAEDGTLVGALDEGVALFSWGGELSVLAEPNFDPTRICFNDGKVGPDGAFWIGGKDRAHRDGIASLERLSADGSRSVVETGLTISNGLDWSPDGRWFYLTDSAPRRIWRYRYDSATGTVSDRSLFADGSEAPGVPDGLAVDAEGCLWSARWGGSQLVRLSPQGEVLTRVAFPVSLVSSCTLGGPEMKTLFVTTAKEDLNPAQRRTEVAAGSVFALDVDVPGLPTRRFSNLGIKKRS
jgi:sugar lactone lactonase YvrE